MTNICSDRLTESRDFYTKLFDLKVEYESDWFVHLASENKKLELGIIDRSNAIVPKEFQHNPQGFYVTFVVNSADEVYLFAKSENFNIIQKPADTAYGQRRLLLTDPN